MPLPDHFRCYICGAIGEKIHDRETRITVYCERCDTFTAYGPVGTALYREQHEWRLRRMGIIIGSHLEEAQQ